MELAGRDQSGGAKRALLWCLFLAVTVSGLVLLAALMVIGYDHESDHPFTVAGDIAQLAVAIAALGAAITALDGLMSGRGMTRVVVFSMLGLLAGAAWLPVLMAVWTG